MNLREEVRVVALREFLSRYVSPDDAAACAHNAACSLLAEEQLVSEGAESDPVVTPENCISASLRILVLEGFEVPHGLVEEAARIWREVRCVPSSSSSL